MGTEEIFPGRILKFGRHFERVEKNFNFSTRDPGRLHACAHARMENLPLLREICKDPSLLSYRKGRSLKDVLVREN